MRLIQLRCFDGLFIAWDLGSVVCVEMRIRGTGIRVEVLRTNTFWGSKIRVWGSGVHVAVGRFEVWVDEKEAWGLGFGVWGLKFEIWDLGYEVWGRGSGV